jgi:hypothetical protein
MGDETSPHHFTMNTLRSISLLTTALLALSLPAPAQTTAQEAYDHLTSAKAALDTYDSKSGDAEPEGKRRKRGGGKQKEKRVGKELSAALSALALVKNNRGTSLVNAKKAIEAAQAELTKGLNDETHPKVVAFVDEAMKQTIKAIDVKR